MKFSPFTKKAKVLLFLLYGLLSFFFNYIKSEPDRCEEYTKKYNGGKHSFKGTEYFIEVCNMGTYENQKFLIFRILDSQKQNLLIRREFSINLYIYISFEIKIFENGFSYFDSSDFTTAQFEEIFVEMPPTWWDKFKANHTNLD